jgi:hypothetical protein
VKKFLAYFWLFFIQLYLSSIYAEKSVVYDANGNIAKLTLPLFLCQPEVDGSLFLSSFFPVQPQPLARVLAAA